MHTFLYNFSSLWGACTLKLFMAVIKSIINFGLQKARVFVTASHFDHCLKYADRAGAYLGELHSLVP
jgi:hypothetical protein